jgi:hypothetical protein
MIEIINKFKLSNRILAFVVIVCSSFSSNQIPTYKFAVLKYNGGGDWYANPTSLPNLVKFCNTNLKTNINLITDFVDVGSTEIFNYPFIHMTGHGNVVFNAIEAQNLRRYLENGGFIHIDDNYGMDKFIRNQLKKVFPNQELVELPFTHKIFHQKYKFNNGLPKIHEHDKKPPQGFGLFHKGKLVLFYSYETDLGDGWEDTEVHNDGSESRKKALQMGANIVQYALNLGEI